jgi:hypothetical protein
MFKFARPRRLDGKVSGLLAAGMAAGAVALFATPAHATLEIELQSGGKTFTQTGNSPLAVDHAIGNFTTTLNTGAATGSPALDLSSLDVADAKGGTLVITLSENDLSGALGTGTWLSQFSGNFSDGDATVSLKTYLDPLNKLLGTGTLLSTFSAFSSPFSFSASKQTDVDSAFAITDVLTITAPSSVNLSLDSLVSQGIGQGTTVPEPATLAILGTGLFSLFLVARRPRRQHAD